jgi:hypothetical protein
MSRPMTVHTFAGRVSTAPLRQGRFIHTGTLASAYGAGSHQKLGEPDLTYRNERYYAWDRVARSTMQRKARADMSRFSYLLVLDERSAVHVSPPQPARWHVDSVDSDPAEWADGAWLPHGRAWSTEEAEREAAAAWASLASKPER